MATERSKDCHCCQHFDHQASVGCRRCGDCDAWEDEDDLDEDEDECDSLGVCDECGEDGCCSRCVSMGLCPHCGSASPWRCGCHESEASATHEG